MSDIKTSLKRNFRPVGGRLQKYPEKSAISGKAPPVGFANMSTSPELLVSIPAQNNDYEMTTFSRYYYMLSQKSP